MKDKSGLTAIKRKTLSVPVRWLHKKGMIGKIVYDYGCGKGDDIDNLRELDHWAAGHDPNHKPVDKQVINDSLWCSDTVLCTYVLNVLDHNKQAGIINRIKSYMNINTTAYITVRRDIKKEGLTKRGTYQENVTLNLPVVRETSTYCIYKLEK